MADNSRVYAPYDFDKYYICDTIYVEGLNYSGHRGITVNSLLNYLKREMSFLEIVSIQVEEPEDFEGKNWYVVAELYNPISEKYGKIIRILGYETMKTLKEHRASLQK